MKNWIKIVIELLSKSIDPIPQELNELDWKADLSQKDDRLHHHLSAFANYEGGGYLVFGISRQGKLEGVEHLDIESIIKKVGNIARDGLDPSISIDHAIEKFSVLTR
jgi:predicted HTH transcriptional regulator